MAPKKTADEMLLIGLTTCLLAAGVLNHVIMTSDTQYDTLVAFGDSITHGHQTDPALIWTTLLQAQLNKACGQSAPKVINAGIGGHTSAQGLARIETDVLAHQPALVLVEFGGNDTSQLNNKYVPLTDFVANLNTMHRKITSLGGQVIFVSFPPVINDWHAHGRNPFFKDAGGLDEYVQFYRDATKTIASELDCQFFDLDQLLRKAASEHGNEALIEPDGVHLKPQAHQLVADALTQFLRPWFTQ